MDLLLHTDVDAAGCPPAVPVLTLGIRVMLLVDGDCLPGS